MIEVVRELALDYEAEVLEDCIKYQIDNGTNPIYGDGTSEEIVGVLSKAKFIREQLDSGMSLQNAMRELARRMRALSEK